MLEAADSLLNSFHRRRRITDATRINTLLKFSGGEQPSSRGADLDSKAELDGLSGAAIKPHPLARWLESSNSMSDAEQSRGAASSGVWA